MVRIIILTLLITASLQVRANVVQDCLPGASAEASHACDTFIEGFIAGALLTDAAIIESIQRSDEGTSFLSRAYRTRLGQQDIPPTYFASFCLPEGVVEAIVPEVRKGMIDLNPNEPLGEVIYRLLKARYPCNE